MLDSENPGIQLEHTLNIPQGASFWEVVLVVVWVRVRGREFWVFVGVGGVPLWVMLLSLPFSEPPVLSELVR
jgi:hypothetical protein